MKHEYTLKTVSVSVRDVDSDSPILGDPCTVGPFVTEFFNTLDSDQEHVILIALDGVHRVTGIKVLSSGTRSQSLVDPQRVFRLALALDARAVIIAHNHPSGQLEPSADDVALTKRLVQGGVILGIPVYDHIISTPRGLWLSLLRSRPKLFAT